MGNVLLLTPVLNNQNLDSVLFDKGIVIGHMNAEKHLKRGNKSNHAITRNVMIQVK